MKKSMTVAAGAVVLLTAAPLFAEAKDDKGMQVFRAQKCTQCHSIAGKGNAKGKLDDVGSKLAAAEIKEWIVDPVGMAAKNKKDRKPPMKKKAISDGDADALVAYLSTLK